MMSADLLWRVVAPYIMFRASCDAKYIDIYVWQEARFHIECDERVRGRSKRDDL